MNKNWIILLLIAFFVSIIIYILYADFSPPSKDDKWKEEIHKLENKLDSLNNCKDSIRTVIDSTHIKIITNENHYKERVNTIIHQPASADSCFITDYIRQYSEQNPLSNTK